MAQDAVGSEFGKADFSDQFGRDPMGCAGDGLRDVDKGTGLAGARVELGL